MPINNRHTSEIKKKIEVSKVETSIIILPSAEGRHDIY
ncbi:hypothetical protein HBHAL_2590 [Halobacillus halophilus DSM 2266]|uniref:Uncharacterized protein n=1 Tax=Halobacillus halophilus (strain ATCC 35676 / DSM 2266 / JCM 20832 / KCTC 3685 / LMG 17431 / NBRC 102448 / NCIMB 2269) TaxID=866895 RepID=I0JLB6_HALH3|nr:hypothetical protein HBHAL_2590 [Halobacillus halophilus DSM 2266]